MIEPNKAGSDTTVGFHSGHAQWKHNGFQNFNKEILNIKSLNQYLLDD